MMRALISLCLRNRPAVILLFIALAALGTRAVLHLDIDSKTHPAWTGGGQHLLDRGGRVSRFNNRYKGLLGT